MSSHASQLERSPSPSRAIAVAAAQLESWTLAKAAADRALDRAPDDPDAQHRANRAGVEANHAQARLEQLLGERVRITMTDSARLPSLAKVDRRIRAAEQRHMAACLAARRRRIARIRADLRAMSSAERRSGYGRDRTASLERLLPPRWHGRRCAAPLGAPSLARRRGGGRPRALARRRATCSRDDGSDGPSGPCSGAASRAGVVA